MERKVCTVRQTGPRSYEVVDPNNPCCPLVGPYEGKNKSAAKSEAVDQAKRLNNFYKDNWPVWSKL